MWPLFEWFCTGVVTAKYHQKRPISPSIAPEYLQLYCHIRVNPIVFQASMNEPRKAVALISGGLDSLLAARVVMDQGVHVEGINFYTGFCVEGHTHAIRKQDRAKPKRNNALWVAEQLGIKLHIVDIIEEYKDVVINPKHGYGANLNPCLDCKIFMVSKARKWIDSNGFDFIITGEVIGQRPKSQRKDTCRWSRASPVLMICWYGHCAR